jgi:putative hydrolase of the HAD superfamily
MIEAVVMDLGGVAARFKPERRLRVLASLTGVGEDVVQEALFDSGFEQRAELGLHSFDDVVDRIRHVSRRSISPNAVVDAWSLAFEPSLEALQCVASLSARKVLFTNNGPVLDACLGGPLQGLAAVFDDVICSWHIGARKPEPAAFERAAERIGCAPERLLLLDDSVANVEGARRCGWEAELVTGPGGLKDVVAIRLPGHI